MKAIDIALKDLVRGFRSASAVVFMFGVPLLVTGLFYFMFGKIASSGEFDVPRTKVVIANLDAGGPRFQLSTRSIPGSEKARTMGDLIVAVLQSKDVADLVEVAIVPSAEAARSAVDGRSAQVALIIPANFSRQYADPHGEAAVEFYQDPTLTIAPEIIRAILNQFMDGMAGVKIALTVYLDEAAPADARLAGQVVQEYLDTSLLDTRDPAAELLETRAPAAAPAGDSLLVRLLGPIMAGMLIFFAFFTAASTAENILKEDEEGTLPRLFTTPTPQAIVLGGKFLAVFLTVAVQVVVLLAAGRLLFGITWGVPGAVALAAAGIVLVAASAGICLNSFMKNTRQGSTVFGGLLTITGMLGMISVLAAGSPEAARLGETVSLLVPQGWAVRGLTGAMNGGQAGDLWPTGLATLAWSAGFFAVGVWRFNRRYA